MAQSARCSSFRRGKGTRMEASSCPRLAVRAAGNSGAAGGRSSSGRSSSRSPGWRRSGPVVLRGTSNNANGVELGSDIFKPDANFEDTVSLPENFCIIEGRTTVQDFAKLGLGELQDGMNARKNKIFLLMEEVRRLRIQIRAKTENTDEEDVHQREYNSAVPFLPPLTDASIKDYYIAFSLAVASIILFGGVIAPTAELKMGIGGTTYADFIRNVGLPAVFAQVDPIVASFTGGAVGVISTLLVVEVNNVKINASKRCVYCTGTGYLSCVQCATKGRLVSPDGAKRMCPTCSGSAKVMCTSCLCTGLAMATEHDPRIDPFD